MKLFLLLISTTLLIAFNYSNSQTIGINSKNNKVISSKTSILQPSQKPDGIIIDSKQLSKTAGLDQDTSRAKSEITRVYTRDNLKFYIEIKLKEDLIPIKLQIYNMLGNLVKDVHDGTVVGKQVEFDFDASNLPNGFYLCILQGPNFRDAEKFTISR
ncbi:MAG: hypothetical protein WC121_03040 [Candidatus Kapaibacterium sp.]